MSVDYYSCNYCGETFPDCGDYVSCEGCGNCWCSEECAEEQGFRIDVDNDEEYSTSCNFCRGEDYEDYELLEKALELLKISREDLIKLM